MSSAIASHAQWAVDIGGAAMGLQIDGNHLPFDRERRQDPAEHFGAAESAV